jgi:hypothetical protein
MVAVVISVGIAHCPSASPCAVAAPCPDGVSGSDEHAARPAVATNAIAIAPIDLSNLISRPISCSGAGTTGLPLCKVRVILDPWIVQIQLGHLKVNEL